MIGYAFCGSFCTLSASLSALSELVGRGCDILPIMSERVYSTDTRFFKAEDFRNRVKSLTGKDIIHTITEAETLGALRPLDALIVAPCTGNTLAKLASGITDSAVTMAVKAHLRCDRPTLIALASNDAVSQNLSNLAFATQRRAVYLVPMYQDDPKGKPHSLVADFGRLPHCFDLMMEGKNERPLFLSK